MLKIKEVLVILDGLMEEKLLNKSSFKEFLFGNIDINYKEEMVDYSVVGRDLDSLNCIMNIFGYNGNKIDIGERSYYEGLNKGIVIDNNQSILRCNVIKVEDGILDDFTGGNLSDDIGKIVEEFNIDNAKTYSCYKYKNLVVIDSIIEDKLYPPHFNVGKKIESIMPCSDILRNIVFESYKYFKENGYEGLMLWPWGISRKVDLPKFKYKAGLVAGIDLVAGMGKALNMKTITPIGCNGDIDTKLEEKLLAVKSLLKEYDYVIVHINGFDEASHRKNFFEKTNFTKKVKEIFLMNLLLKMKDYEEYKIRITCDHRSDSGTGLHEKGTVPNLTIFAGQ